MNQFLNPPVLMILDVQKGFDDPYWGKRNNPNAEENILQLLMEWRKRSWKVVFSLHLSLLPKSPLNHKNKEGTDFKEKIKPEPNEKVFTKNVNSAFIGTQLESYLRENKVSTVVITGLSTQHCVSTTTRMSGNLGFDTYLVSDAIAAFEINDQNGNLHTPDEIQRVELATLHKEFATIMTTKQILKKI
ncbi:cysteine hydrolase family protein [Bacillus sp. AK128]